MVMKILILIFVFEIKESKITRGHNYTLVKKQSRLYFRKYAFSMRRINVRNKLSKECVHASSVNMFKNRIDKYLVKGRGWSKTGVCHISVNNQWIFTKFSAVVHYVMSHQIIKFQLICIIYA